MADNDPNKRADKCGNPFPDVCIPTTVRTPICFSTNDLIEQGVLQGLPGFLVVTIGADCSATAVAIEDINGSTPAGAFQVACPDTNGPGGIEQPPPQPQGGV